MNQKIVPPAIPTPQIYLSLIEEKIEHLSAIRTAVQGEKTGWAPILALIIALILNIWGFMTQETTYMVVWISASLYFYLFYPMLPILLFPFRYLTKKDEPPDNRVRRESPVTWVIKLKIYKSLETGFRLFLRFFILSLLPLTLGMICIYLLSVLFSFILGGNGIIPGNTTALIIIQSAGIILFYVEIFFFRDRLVHFIGYIRRETTAEKKKIVLLGILGLALLVVGTVVVILLLIAILMPGFTLVNFINVYEFVRERSNFWILIILISQMVFMLCLQSLLSRRITLGMCDDMIDQLRSARADLQSGIHSIANTGISGTDQNEIRQMRNTLKILKETGLYAFNRRPMFGIFPIYSVGISLPALFEIESLSDLEDIFFFEK